MSLSILLASALAQAEKVSILNVFFDSSYHELTVNTVNQSQRTGFLRVQNLQVRSSRFLPCKSEIGCLARIQGEGPYQLSILAGGVTRIARVTINPEGLLPSKAFKLLQNGMLLLDLDQLATSNLVRVD